LRDTADAVGDFAVEWMVAPPETIAAHTVRVRRYAVLSGTRRSVACLFVGRGLASILKS